MLTTTTTTSNTESQTEVTMNPNNNNNNSKERTAKRALEQKLEVGCFFFKQKTAYEMLRSLVGSEMCIRDR